MAGFLPQKINCNRLSSFAKLKKQRGIIDMVKLTYCGKKSKPELNKTVIVVKPDTIAICPAQVNKEVQIALPVEQVQAPQHIFEIY